MTFVTVAEIGFGMCERGTCKRSHRRAIQRALPDGGVSVIERTIDRPVSVSGTCPVEDVKAFARGEADRMSLMPLADGLGDDQAIEEAAIDELRAELAEIEAMAVPPCVEDILAAEVAFNRKAIDMVERMQAAEGLLWFAHGSMDFIVLARTGGDTLERIRTGYDMLEDRLGIDFGPIRYGGYPDDAGSQRLSTTPTPP